MARQYLIDININDTLQDVIRKCNHNFRMTRSKIQNTAIRDLSEDVDVALDELTTALTNEINRSRTADSEMNDKIDRIVFDQSGRIDPSILPSYIDDVIEVYPLQSQTELSRDWLSDQPNGNPITPETGKIYITLAASENYLANSQFRWSGNSYINISASTSNYNNLINKPSIENVTLENNKTFDELGISSISNARLEEIFIA